MSLKEEKDEANVWEVLMSSCKIIEVEQVLFFRVVDLAPLSGVDLVILSSFRSVFARLSLSYSYVFLYLQFFYPFIL